MLATQEKSPEQLSNTLYCDNILDQQTWERLSRRIGRERGFSPRQCDEIVDGTVSFLKMCGDYPNRTFSPSPLVDIGWHEFLMYTREYQRFCEQIAGRFIHHSPTDLGDGATSKPTAKETLEFMVSHSIPFYMDQWRFDGAMNCNNHCENNVNCNNHCENNVGMQNSGITA